MKALQFTLKKQKVQWESEIHTSLYFEWSKRGLVANGLDFEWDLEAQPFKIKTNDHHFVQNHLKSGQKCPDFERSGFRMVETIAIAIAKALPLKLLLIQNNPQICQ